MGNALRKVGTGTAGSTTVRNSTNSVELGDHNNLSDIKQCNVTASGNAPVNVNVNFESNADELGSCRTEDVTTLDLKRRLKEWYSDLQLPVITWMRRGNFPLEEYYFPLQLNSVRRASSIKDATGYDKSKTRGTSDALNREIPNSQLSVMDNVKSPINLTNIFDTVDGESPKRIFIESQPGLGKTTLAHKIMHDWQKGENYTARFDLAMLIPLRYLRGKSLRDMVLEILKANDDAAKVWKLINSDRMLLVLDGLDEVGESTREDVLKVLYDKIDFKMTILVTCRTGLFELEERERDSLFSGVAKRGCFWDKKIEILGFDDESRRKFLDTYITVENKDEILDEITEVIEPMEDVLQSPLILILLVYILLDYETFTITTITELYKKLVDCIIKRSVNRDKSAEIDKSFSLFNKALRGDYHVNFCKFGEKSLDRILNDSLQFECDDLTELIYRMGFLIKHETRKNNFKVLPHYECCHLTFLEFTAAYSLWDKFQSNGNEFTDLTLHKINEICLKKKSASMILPFLCGLMGGDVKKLFNQLRNFRPLYKYLHEYLMLSILRECEESDEVCEILAHFFLEAVTISCYEILFLRNKVLTKHIVMMHIDCDELPKLAQLGNIYIESIYVRVLGRSSIDLSERLNSTTSVSCKNLFIDVTARVSYGDMAYHLRFLLNDVSCKYKQLRMGKTGDHNLINECVENNIFTNQTLDSLNGYLTREQISIDLIINITKYNTVKRLEISVNENSNLNYLYTIFHLLRSNSLWSVVILFSCYAMEPEPQLDLNNVTNNEELWVQQKVMISEVNKECIESFEVIGDCNTNVKNLWALKPKELRCSYKLYDRLMLDPQLLTWTVTNLTLDIWNRSLETLSCLGKLISLKKVAFCVHGTLDHEQQRSVVECLHTLTLDQLQFFCNVYSLVTDVVNGIKDLRGKNKLTSIRNIDFELASEVTCSYAMGWDVDECLEFLSALRMALLNDIRMTVHFCPLAHNDLRFRDLFAICNIFDISQFEIQQNGRKLSFKSEFLLNLHHPYGSVWKIQKKNTPYD